MGCLHAPELAARRRLAAAVVRAWELDDEGLQHCGGAYLL